MGDNRYWWEMRGRNFGLAISDLGVRREEGSRKDAKTQKSDCGRPDFGFRISDCGFGFWT